MLLVVWTSQVVPDRNAAARLLDHLDGSIPCRPEQLAVPDLHDHELSETVCFRVADRHSLQERTQELHLLLPPPALYPSCQCSQPLLV